MTLAGGDPIAGALMAAIRGGDLDALEWLLAEQPGLASAGIADAKGVSHAAAHRHRLARPLP